MPATVLRTPESSFANLPGYAFGPHYVEIGGLRMHYVDEGPLDGQPVLMLHGEPSWSYLYRKMIPIISASGLRAIAPDLIGFGRSDKLADRAEYTYQRHVDWMHAFIRALDLRRITLVCQDWGGFIGLRIAAETQERFARIVAANTFLPTGDHPPGDGFFAWRKYSQEMPRFDAGAVAQMMTATNLAPDVVAAYAAPFPEEQYAAAARQFPLLVPTTPDDPASEANRAAWAALRQFRKPFLTAFSDLDPAFGGAAQPGAYTGAPPIDRYLQDQVPGASGQPHVTIRGASHFLQEDRGPELAQVVVDFVARNPAERAI
jgi:haloalkane dehalogenase